MSETFKFDTNFIQTTNLLLDTYQEAIDYLNKLTSSPSKYIEDMYGVCNNRYRIRYITPHNVSTFVSYLVKALRMPQFMQRNVDDFELLSASMIEEFVKHNEGCVPFEYNTVYATGQYMNPRTVTMGQLVLISRNEYYDNGVCSKSDMLNRAEALEHDVKLLTDLKFTSNMRKLIANIPDVLKGNVPDTSFTTTRLLKEFIERFIQTAIMINLATCEQMLAYCVPRASYNLTKIVKDPDKRLDYDYYGEGTVYFSDGIVSESVDLSKNSPVFINLSNGGNNLVSNSIRAITHSDWSHASISFDPHMDEMYTFNGGAYRDNVYGRQKHGFQREALHSSKFDDVRVRVYCVFVPNDVLDRMKDAVKDMESHNPKYDYVNIVSKAFNDDARRSDSQYRQVCSSFVNSILAIAGKPLADKELASPKNLDDAAKVNPTQVFQLYDGPGGQYDYDTAMEKLTEFAKATNTKTFSESYVTECCMLKTNDLRLRGQIPFNCNMRDIVLQDVHPQFKDTKSAIRFMLGDDRSPVTGLIRKFKTIEEYPGIHRILPMFAQYKPSFVRDSNDLPNKYGMHTDVNWLDKITYGNQFLDGNYRTDSMGNNKFSPIEYSLENLYRMFNCEGMKTNQDLANNVYEVACAMLDLIDAYSDDPMSTNQAPALENRELIRDILAVLGEILTRSMLKLFYNNTQCISASDDMPESGGPGYMYTEGFVLEAENESASKSNDTGGKPGAQAVDSKGQAVKPETFGQKLSALIKKFMQWVSTTLAKIAGKFSQDHKAEIDWITKNSQLNDEIGKALAEGTFHINLTNFPNFNVQADSIMKWNDAIPKVIDDACANNTEVSAKSLLAQICESSGTEFTGAIQNAPNNAEVQKIIQNYVLYKSTTVPAVTAAEALTQPKWNSEKEGLVNDLLNTAKLLNEFSKKTSESLKNATTKVQEAIKKAQAGEKADAAKTDAAKTDAAKSDATNAEATDAAAADTGASPEVKGESSIFDITSPIFMEQGETAGGNGNVSLAHLENVQKAVQDLTNIFQVNIINAVIRKFYADTYKVYRDIVTAYKQQTNTQQQPAENQADTDTQKKLKALKEKYPGREFHWDDKTGYFYSKGENGQFIRY